MLIQRPSCSSSSESVGKMLLDCLNLGFDELIPVYPLVILNFQD